MVRHSLGMFQATPVLDFDRDPSLDMPYGLQQNPRFKFALSRDRFEF